MKARVEWTTLPTTILDEQSLKIGSEGTSKKYLYYAPQSACAHTVAAKGKEGVLGPSSRGNPKACFWPSDTFCAAQAHLRT
jgi:hypothetical protein